MLSTTLIDKHDFFSMLDIEKWTSTNNRELLHYCMTYLAQAYDHKGVGSIKKERLREVFDSYGLSGPTLSEEELNMIVRNADVDGDGVVTLEDFRALVSAKQKGDAPGASDSSNIDGGKS